MKYLFLVSIGVSAGSVQEFIASARRTRDLHFGSWFLSELSRAAAYTINHHNQKSLIFPAPENMAQLQPDDSFMVANRILALIEQDPGELAVLVQEAVFQRLYRIRDTAYKGRISLSADQQAKAEKQINDLVELMWVALPYDEPDDYPRIRKRVEALMATRKNTYDFQTVKGDYVPKSSIDGQLESIIPEEEYPDRRDPDSEKLRKARLLYERYGAGPAERLSGVDLLKRHGTTASGTGFQSTSHIAALPFLQRMEVIKGPGHEALRSAWNTYVETLRRLVPAQITFILGWYDASLLFEERLPEVLNLPPSDALRNTTLQTARQSLHEFYEELDRQFRLSGFSSTRPSTYYALLQADGDSMGNLIDALAEQGDKEHRKLSLALSRFAEQVHGLVSKYQGALVYAGGDDVLAFLPLHTVLACAIDLKTHFYDALKDLAEPLNRQPPTLSVGIAIVHHLDSLRQARRLAHDAEQQAKRKDGKDALAITVSKRGGEDYQVVGKWGNIDVRFSQLVTYCHAASIPVGMAYELRDLVLRLSVPTTDPQYATLQNVIRLDTLRILLRKLTVPAGKLPPDQVKEIEAFLRVQLALPPKEQKGKLSTFQGAGEAHPPEKKKDEQSIAQVSVEMFINELVIAQMLAEAEELAQPRKGVKI
ncbi:MAG TPA: type III-B CRISPR-associated protein Cas10/Cmr2 [Ktedonobacteraceae bacterium]|nr:type III-B CRISPR-associated protein Cas10/Cmr2 [Ktedonobacteraceae bacterium]